MQTAEGKWVLWEMATGRRLERWPVDARDMLATGAFALTEGGESAHPVRLATWEEAAALVPGLRAVPPPAPEAPRPKRAG